MNVRILIGVAVIALGLSILELSCVTHDEPITAHRASYPTEAPEHDPVSGVDVEVAASPILTR